MTQALLETELEALNVLRQEAEQEKSRVSSLVNQTSASVANYSDQIADAEETIDALESMIDEQEQDIVALQKKYEEELAMSRLAAKYFLRPDTNLSSPMDWRRVSNIIIPLL